MKLELERYTLKNDLLFEHLPNFLKMELLNSSKLVKIKKGKVIYREGTYPKGVYIIKKGKIKIFQTNTEGRAQIMYIYCKNDIIGYRPIISSERHPVTAEALEETSCYYITKETFLKILYSHPEFMKQLLIALSHEFTIWVNNITVFAQQSVKRRVALGLIILEKKYKQKGKPTEINLSRDDFAAYIGTVKETLVRVLKEFKLEGYIISKGRRITIKNHEALERIASNG